MELARFLEIGYATDKRKQLQEIKEIAPSQGERTSDISQNRLMPQIGAYITTIANAPFSMIWSSGGLRLT